MSTCVVQSAVQYVIYSLHHDIAPTRTRSSVWAYVNSRAQAPTRMEPSGIGHSSCGNGFASYSAVLVHLAPHHRVRPSPMRSASSCTTTTRCAQVGRTVCVTVATESPVRPAWWAVQRKATCVCATASGFGPVGFVFVDGFLCAECLEQRDRIDKLALELAYCAPPALIALRAVLYRVAPFYW